MMKLIPTIRIQDGRVVQIARQASGVSAEFSEEPLVLADRFRNMGIETLQFVDMNAMRGATSAQLDLIPRLKKAAGLKLQYSGAIHSMDALDSVLSAGADACVISSSTLENEAFIQQALTIYGDRLIIEADCRGAVLASDFAGQGKAVPFTDFARAMRQLSCRGIIYNDLENDRSLSDSFYRELRVLVDEGGMDVCLTGCVSDDCDLVTAEFYGIAAVIVDKAYYEGRIDLPRCINYLRRLEGLPPFLPEMSGQKPEPADEAPNGPVLSVRADLKQSLSADLEMPLESVNTHVPDFLRSDILEEGRALDSPVATARDEQHDVTEAGEIET